MIQFVDFGKKYPATVTMVIATVSLVLFVYVLGGFGLYFDYQNTSKPFVGNGPAMSDFIDALGANRVFFWLIFPFVLVFLVFIAAVKWIHKRPVLSIFTGRTRFDWSRVVTSFLLVFGVLGLMTCLQVYFSEEIVWNFKWNTFIPLCVISFLMIPFQTTIEELLFRGYLLQGLKRKLGSNIHAVILSGIFFGLIHFGNPEIELIGYHILIYYVLIGVFLGCLTLFDNGMELSIGFHAANNIFAALIVSSDWQVFQTDALFIDYAAPEFTLSMFVVTFLFLLGLFFLFRRIYKWSSLKEYLS